jgi:hypothetical protein
MSFVDRWRTVGGLPPSHGLTLRLLVLGAAAASAGLSQSTPRLDTTTFVVIGEGLAAGQAGPGLSENTQKGSFPALIAQQMGTAFAQPLMQGPWNHDVLGFPSVAINAPALSQGATRVQIRATPTSDPSPPLFILNISVPNARLTDALSRRPALPLIQEKDRQQTILNLILGFPLWSQAEYAEAMFPTLALVELGYFEALEAAVRQQPDLVPAPATFREGYTSIVRRLRALQTQVIVTTIPDPTETGYFIRPQVAAQLTSSSQFVIQAGYGVGNNDLLSSPAINEIGSQFIRRKIEPLAPGLIMRAAMADQIRARVRALNTEIQNVARDNGAVVYDLAALFSRMRSAGAVVGGRRLTGEYFGGFYSLDGYYPGTTGHALIANDILGLINRTYGRSFALVDAAAVSRLDPIVSMSPPLGNQVFGARELGVRE